MNGEYRNSYEYTIDNINLHCIEYEERIVLADKIQFVSKSNYHIVINKLLFQKSDSQKVQLLKRTLKKGKKYPRDKLRTLSVRKIIFTILFFTLGFCFALVWLSTCTLAMLTPISSCHNYTF